MSPEQLAQLGAFIQVDRPRYQQPGAGLGLAIVRLVAELYGGQAVFEERLRPWSQSGTLTTPGNRCE